MAVQVYCCLVTVLGLWSASVGSEMVAGGITDIDLNNETNRNKIQEKVNFAVEQYNKQSNDLYFYKPCSIIRAQKQVVEGINYIITVKITKTECAKNRSSGYGDGQSCDVDCSNGEQASGVQVDNSVILLFQEMKLKKSGKKAVFFGFSRDEKYIIVEEGKEILSEDCANFFPRLKTLFPENKCCYALLDIHYITGESKKQDLIFVMWAPEDAPIKEKLLFASSKPYLKQAFSGVNKQWELHSQDDLTVDQLAQKLTSGKIKSLEGHLL